jgi:hypothetical protein
MTHKLITNDSISIYSHFLDERITIYHRYLNAKTTVNVSSIKKIVLHVRRVA